MTPNFPDKELTCKCGCGMLPQLSAVQRLEKLRASCGFPFPLSSAARCSKHNTEVSTTGAAGPHTTGRAFDIAVSGQQAFILVKKALEFGYTGVGISQKGFVRFVHIDDIASDKRPAIWSY